MQSKPSISVVIPAYNREAFIAESVESVLRQTVPPDEIVVVDDGSADDTLKIAKRFEDRGVVCIEKGHNGAAATRNVACAACRGDYILVMDSDDVIFEDSVERLVAVYDREPGLDVYYGDLVATDELLKPIKRIKYPQWRGREDRLFSAHAFTNQIGNPFCLMRREWLRIRGGYAEDFDRCEDWELWCRSTESMSVCHVEADLGYWRWHTKNMSANRAQHVRVSDDRTIRTRVRLAVSREEHVSRLGWESAVAASANREALIWGAGEYGEAVDEMLRRMGVDAGGFVDSDPRMAGQTYRGRKVRSPDELRQNEHRPYIFVASVYEHEISMELERMDFAEIRDFARPHGVEYHRL